MSLFGGGGNSDFDIKITADGRSASAELERIQQAFEKFSTGITNRVTSWAKDFFSVSNAMDFLGDSIKAAVEDERALSALRTTMASVGEEAATERLASYADHLQEITTVSAESIQGLEALAVNMGVSTSRVEEAVQAAIGLKRAYQLTDARQALQAYTQAMQGNYRAVTALIPEMKKINDEKALQAKLSEKAAQGWQQELDYASKGVGAMERYANLWDEAKSSLGKGVLDGMSSVGDQTEALKRLADVMGMLGRAIGHVIEGATLMPDLFREIYAKVPFVKVVTVGAAMFLDDTAGDVLLGGKKGYDNGYNDDNSVDRTYEYRKAYSSQASRAQQLLAQAQAANDAARKKSGKRLSGWGDDTPEKESALASAIREHAQALSEIGDAFRENAKAAASYASAEDALFWGQGDAETMLQEAVLDPLDRVLLQSREALDKFWPTVTESTEETMARIGAMLQVPELEQQTEILLPEAGKQWSLFGDSVDNTADAMQMAGQTAGMMGRGLSDLGILSDSASRTVENLASSVASIFAAVKAGSVFGVIGAGIGALGALGSALAGAGHEWGKHADNALKSVRGYTSQTRALLKQLAEEVGNGDVAMALNFRRLFETAEIRSLEDLESWASKAHDIISVWEWGGISAADAVTSIGDAWGAMTEKMSKWGGVVSAEMLRLMRDAKAAGLQIDAIDDHITNALSSGADALAAWVEAGEHSAAELADLEVVSSAYWASMLDNGDSFLEVVKKLGPTYRELAKQMAAAGVDASGMFAEFLRYADLAGANEALFTSIDSLQSAFRGLADSGYLTADSLAAISRSAGEMYEKLIAGGATSDEALRILAPTLAQLWYYAEQYGYALDDATRALVEQAAQQGLINDSMIPPTERIYELIYAIAEALGAEIPEALRKAADKSRESTDSIRDDLQRLKRDIEDIDEVGSGSGRSRGGGGADDGGGSSGGTPTARWSGSPAAAPVAVSLQLPATAIRYDVPALIRDIRANRDGLRNAIREVVA